MPNSKALSASSSATSPDYVRLVQFLLTPLIESPQSLSIDCEQSKQNQKIWLRLAFEGSDRGRVFGRGGRNIQAIRTVLEAAAATVNQSIYLDIYGGYEDYDQREDVTSGRSSDRRHNAKPIPSGMPRRPPSKSSRLTRPHN
jgi:hypothetical protein